MIGLSDHQFITASSPTSLWTYPKVPKISNPPCYEPP